jgi:hypothetical protein
MSKESKENSAFKLKLDNLESITERQLQKKLISIIYIRNKQVDQDSMLESWDTLNQ